MLEEQQALLISNPRRFLEIVLDDNIESRTSQLHVFDDFIVCEVLRHGILNDTSALPGLIDFYRRIFLQAQTRIRLEIYRHVARIVPQLGSNTAGAFIPFMLLDPDATIVSTAAIDYASLGGLIDGNPLSRPLDVAAMISPDRGRKDLPANRGAVFGGLLCLGDERVCNLLAPIRRDLNAEEIRMASHCYSGITHRAVVEFYLDWLEELLPDQSDEGLGRFGHVAAGLHRQGSARQLPFVSDGLRPFPVPSDDRSPWPEVSYIDFAEFSERISSRLLAIEAAEQAPKVMPYVLNAFNIKKRSSQVEVAQIPGLSAH